MKVLMSEQIEKGKVVLLALVALLMPYVSFAEEAAVPEASAKSIRVGMITSRPMAFMKDGKAYGFEVEMLQELMPKVGVAGATWKQYNNPNEIIAALKNGEIDLGIGGITRTGERERDVDFVHHHGDFGLAIAVRSDDESIYTEADLKGKAVCTKGQTTSVPYAKKFGAKLTEVKDIDECWPLLKDKKVEAIFFDSAPLWHHVHTSKDDTFQVIDKLFAVQYYALMLPNRSDRAEDWNIAVADFLFSEKYEALWAKYLGDFE